MTEQNPIPKSLDKWCCLGCRFLLGYVEDKETVRIKRKDLYVEVKVGTDGKISTNCPRCGKPNWLEDNAPKQEIVDLKD